MCESSIIDDLQAFERIARNRKTLKLMAEHDLPTCDSRQAVERLLACAGWAPFHRICHGEHRTSGQPTGVEPWRFHVVGSDQCRRLRKIVKQWEAAGKIPALLAAAEVMIVATWLPNPPSNPIETGDTEHFEPSLENVEHIAAASAAVQSLILAATAAGLDSYWSSGGVLRQSQILQRLGVPSIQRFLGAIFLFPSSPPSDVPLQAVGSKLRPARSGPAAWARWVTLDDV